jgi:type IV pilus assembly protein PilY1
MNQFSRACRGLSALVAATFLLVSASPALADVDLANAPLFSTVSVPGNLLLALSVEYPTASTSAYPSTIAYATASTYVGYFDPAKCYTYNSVNSGTTSSPNYSTSYFVPSSTAQASLHTCASMWSGNWLNWASMQSLDEFRWVLTGGNRVVDSSTQTILQKTYHSGQDTGSAVNKAITGTLVNGATPLSTWTTVNSRISGTGIKMLISSCAGGSGTGLNATTPTSTDFTAGMTTSITCSSGAGTNYALYMNVQVCAGGTLNESNCVLYGTSYKPEGLMQSYSSKLRYAAMGYLNDKNLLRDGGVLRAGMKYIAPTQPVPGSPAITNSVAEWSSTDGTMGANPNPTDASATQAAAITAGASSSFTVTQSGVMNYLNKFGYYASSYKQYDPVSEMYYAGIRYFKNLGNVASYSDLSAGTSSTIPTWVDGFPVITTWTDPIVYACQKNFILGIGDSNTHRDGNLPGSTVAAAGQTASQEPATPTEVTNDKTIAPGGAGVATATNMVDTLENGTATLGSAYVSAGRYDTYYIAGLAYDAHTSDIRPDLPDAQTISTYWLDVLEGQTYKSKNEYYYATKYGGFTFPDNVQAAGGTDPTKSATLKPYATGNATNTLTTTTGSISFALSSGYSNALWHTNTDICNGTSLCASGNTAGDYRPDNYFTANNADAMKASLTSAFQKIVAEASAANGTSLSTPNVNTVNSGSVTFGATYDPTTWTGKVTASNISFAADGTPTTTPAWDARTLLSASSVTATSRKIVTCCTTSAAPGLAFTDTALSGSTLISRTNYASFGAVPGVATQSRANFLLYLRGDTSKELPPNGTGVYRDRSYRLGDIVNSKPTAVGAPNQVYYDSSNPGYSTFKTTYASRATVVYAGANDGMLHAFDGSTGTTGGKELFAYVPSFVYGNGTSTTTTVAGTTTTTATATATTGLPMLGNPTFNHYYYVDATPGQFDVDLMNTYASSTAKATSTTNSMCTASQTGTATNNWCSLLIGGLGKGGKGYYALDVTDPTTWTTEANVAAKVLWEFTDTHMGYTFGTPSVVKTKKWGWVVVLTSGYNNDNGVGYFYFVSPSTGALLEQVATPSGSTASPINMGQHTAYEPDYTDGTADAIYGVDLQGDVWRLDVTAASGSYPSPTKIATLADASGNAQPITTRPLIERDNSSSARYVLVGTGRLLGDSDVSSALVQSFYAIIDGTADSGKFYTSATLPSGVTFPLTRSELNANTNLLLGITLTAGTTGWYYDLPVTNSIAERVDVDPTVTSGVVAWAGNLPNGSACSPAGTGETYATAFSTGKTVLWDTATNTYKSAIPDTAGVITDLSFMGVNGTTYLYSGDSTGAIAKDATKIGSTSGVKQLNWRDVPLAN